ncbi:molybdenum cofactor guanylyltransferase [Aureispira anguillae]|uniref:Probable molybdenum cofactor guanylyltransferase n=1 Tax=Aureispira anguillae TaxID=2864201 RepID=A0A915YB82_9BACT|nr:molybdenum cofactor guanylyltransferase [Aureispira anguillae]BDS09884.1 molybdenum cofactor guanylyltransferase [Aureispira anguillae]
MINKKQLTAVILAGGKSQRMGEDKAFLMFQQQTFIEHIIHAVQPLVTEVVIIGAVHKYKQLGLTVYKDKIADQGPVGGIHTALSIVKTPYLLVLSCDIPLVSTQLLQYLIENSLPCDVNVMTIRDKHQPLTALYKRTCLSVFEHALEQQQLKLQALFEQMEVHKIPCPLPLISCLENINTPKDFQRIKNENQH